MCVWQRAPMEHTHITGLFSELSGLAAPVSACVREEQLAELQSLTVTTGDTHRLTNLHTCSLAHGLLSSKLHRSSNSFCVCVCRVESDQPGPRLQDPLHSAVDSDPRQQWPEQHQGRAPPSLLCPRVWRVSHYRKIIFIYHKLYWAKPLNRSTTSVLHLVWPHLHTPVRGRGQMKLTGQCCVRLYSSCWDDKLSTNKTQVWLTAQQNILTPTCQCTCQITTQRDWWCVSSPGYWVSSLLSELWGPSSGRQQDTSSWRWENLILVTGLQQLKLLTDCCCCLCLLCRSGAVKASGSVSTWQLLMNMDECMMMVR